MAHAQDIQREQAPTASIATSRKLLTANPFDPPACDRAPPFPGISSAATHLWRLFFAQAVFVQAPNKYATVISLLAAGLPQQTDLERQEAVRGGMRTFIELGTPIITELTALFATLGLEDTRQV